ncbi:hypothetical protein CBP52_17200 [Cellulomonas sp. PSBB021]|nr:hypothetical protein CBP52_17200 [Cellulomonas sp. PSBB021]
MSKRRRFMAVLAVVVGMAVIGPAAGAVTIAYATSSSPQVAKGYGSTGKTFGNWSLTKGSSSAVSKITGAYYYLDNKDDHKVYVHLKSIAAIGNLGPHQKSSKSQLGKQNHIWTRYKSLPVHTYSVTMKPVKVRVDALVKTCLDIPSRPDVCSSGKAFYSYLNY